jgi:hypothetical protein
MITCTIDFCKQVIWLQLVLKYFQIAIQKSYHDGSKYLDGNDDKCHNKMHWTFYPSFKSLPCSISC